MIEIISRPICASCGYVTEILDRDGISYTLYDREFQSSDSRVMELIQEADSEGYTKIPLIFQDGQCIGSGVGALYNIRNKKE